MYAWDLQGYAIILKLFTGYTLWADNYIAESELEGIFELRLELCSDRLELKDETIYILQEDRDHAYDLFNQERKDKPKLERRNTIKIVLISGGTAIVGVAAGILIGFFAGK